MPPKKKQQQIDLSTLPQCVSSNAIILCRGKKQRSQRIIAKIFGQYKQFLSKISRQEVLDHAKQKNIYVDANTLTEKQKKDPKFMQSICTELSAQIVAKATKSLIDHLSIKTRVQLKSQQEKPQEQRAKPLLQRKMDKIFVFPTQFFQSRQQYEALASINQSIGYVLVLNPGISWANGPQLPEHQSQEQQGQQQEDQIRQLRQLKAKQQLDQQDEQYNQSITQKIDRIKQFRRYCRLDSPFRDCIIDQIDAEIDPYNQQQSISEIVKTFLSRLSKLTVEYDQFLEWKKDKPTQAIIQNSQDHLQAQQTLSQHQEPKQNGRTTLKPLRGTSTIQILQGFVDSLFSVGNDQQQQDDDAQSLVNGFDFDVPITDQSQSQAFPGRKDKKSYFYPQNQSAGQAAPKTTLEQQSRSRLQYPGIDRYLMPEVPLKSSPLRKLQRSQYAQFLNQNLPLEEFQRRLSLLKFEEILKEIDEDRKYCLNDRVYEQHHDQNSLMRQLYRALAINEEAHFLTKYNEQNDKLYLALLYRNNQRRVHTKLWESGWKVLPNYQSWLNYFKDNETNLNTQSFYDIDYEKIGHINDRVYAFSIPDGGVMISKKSTIANRTNEFLYGIKNHHLFGLSQGVFHSQNKTTKVNHFQTDEGSFQTQIILANGMRLRLQLKTGDIMVEAKGQARRAYTPDGYTIIHEDQSALKNYKILHPTGGVTQPHSYINESGKGMKNGSIQDVPSLLRRTEGYQIIKRDDNTVIIQDEERKWVKFYQGTEYLVAKGQVCIEKKGLPFIKCINGTIQAQVNDLTIRGQKGQDGNYVFYIQYADGNKLRTSNSQIEITQLTSQIVYRADISKGEFNIQFGNQKYLISKESIRYRKNEVEYNPVQNQENYAQDQTLPTDHLQPRLFIMSPDNTGVEYLSQEQLRYYFKLRSGQKDHTISSISNGKHSQNVHIVSKIVEAADQNPRRINLDLNIDLDIFQSQRYLKEKSLTQKFTVRSLTKHKHLLPEDQQQIEQIKDNKQEWVKRVKKQENQFGHKPNADPIVQQISRDKNIAINFRKKQMPRVDSQQLREQALSEWKYKEKEHMTLVAQKQQQEKIRMRLNKRKQSLAESYPPLVIARKEQIQEGENYSPAGFYTHYFQTNQGKKALAAMPEWVFRPKTAKVTRSLDPQIVTQLNNTMNRTRKQQPQLQQDQQAERYDTVDVNLSPVRQIYIKPSVFTQREIDQERQAFEYQKKAYFYHEKKRKQFSIYGTQRKDKPEVKSLIRTQPISEINQKYLITEAPLDKKIKISSMKNKLTSQASSLVEMRKQGPHTTLLRTLDKRNDYNTLLEKRTMMVHADLNDKLQRDILITPVQAEFGYLKEGRSYELKIIVKNQDILAQRLVVKKARNINVKVMMNQMGPIALGMTRRIIVQIKAASQFLGRFTDEFEIVTKHQIYKIPVSAHILTQSQHENQNIKLSPNVKQISELLKRKTSGLPPIN